MRTSDKKAQQIREAVTAAGIARGLNEAMAAEVAETAVSVYRTPLNPKRETTTVG